MALGKDPFKDRVDPTQSPDLSFLEKVEGTVTDNLPTNEVELESNDPASLEATEKPIEIDPTKDLEEEEQLYASIFPKKIPKPNKKQTLTDKPYGETFEEIRQKQEEMFSTKVEGEGYVIEPGSGNIIFSEFSDESLNTIDETLNNLNMGNLDAVKGSLQSTLKDLDQYDVASFQDAVYTIFENSINEAKRGKISVKDIAAEAAKLGRNDIYAKILNRKPGEILDLPSTYRGIIETKILQVETERLANIIVNGTPSEQEITNFYQMLRLYGAVNAQVAGSVSETGRTLGIVSKIEIPQQATSLDIKKILETEMGADFSLEGVKNIASSFLTLKPHQQTKFAKDSFSTKLRDAWAEVWVMSKLSSPITHAINTVGTLSFNVLRVAEYAAAAGLNKVPGIGSKDGVMFNEVFNMIKSIKYGSKLGLVNAYESIKTGEAVSTKIDLRKSKSFGKRLLPEKLQNSPMGRFLEMIGTINRIPGTALIAEDEFVKGIAFQMELERLATVNYNQALNDGLSEDQAQKVYIDTLSNPNNSVVQQAEDAMLEGSFQKNLPDGFLRNSQKFFNIPEVKLFVPFYKTIMNIFFETNKRNPIMMLAGGGLDWRKSGIGSKIRADLSGKNGKKTQQLALSKMMLGGTLMYQFGSMTYGNSGLEGDMLITGMAPGDKAEREAFYRKGLQPYSIAFKDEKTGQFVSYSYSRFDPISALLAISADIGYLSSRPDQYGDPEFTDKMTALFTNGLIAIYPYLTEQPFLQGIPELGRILSPGYGDPEGKFDRTMALLTEKFTEASISLGVNATGSFGNYLEKLQDPTIYDYEMTTEQANDPNMLFFGQSAEEYFDGDVPTWLRAFYKEYNRAAKASPYYNPNLKPRLNLFGEPMEGPEMGVFSPIKIKNAKFSRLDDFLLKVGLGISMPKYYIDGIKLTSDEYHDYIKLINTDYDGDGISDMLYALDQQVQDPVFLEMLPGDQFNMLNDIVSEYKMSGKEEFLSTNPDFRAKTEALKEKIKIRGKR